MATLTQQAGNLAAVGEPDLHVHHDALAPSWAATRSLDCLGVLKKKVVLCLWHEKSLVLHRLCTLRCFGLPKFPSQFWVEVKLLCAVKIGRGVVEGGGEFCTATSFLQTDYSIK